MLYIIGAVGWVERNLDGKRIRYWGGAGYNIGMASYVNGIKANLISILSNREELILSDKIEQSLLGHCERRSGNTANFVYEFSDDNSEPTIKCDFGVLINLSEYICNFTTAFTNEWVHICCRSPLDCKRVISHILNNKPKIVSLDFMYTSINSILPDLFNHLQSVKFIFMNELEYQISTKLGINKYFNGNLVVTRGSRGACILKQSMVICETPGIVQNNVVDTSGAGDVFTGTFISSIIKGINLIESLNFANSVASASISDYGINQIR